MFPIIKNTKFSKEGFIHTLKQTETPLKGILVLHGVAWERGDGDGGDQST